MLANLLKLVYNLLTNIQKYAVYKYAVIKGIIIDANEIIASRNERKLTTEVCEQI